jgi:curli biogenesis system outer membrane secretion channel CsgG
MNRFNGKIIILSAALVFMPLFAQANIDIVNVKSEGIGQTLNEAVDDALVQAISMVNGKSIESETLLKTKSQSKSTNEGSVFSNEKEMQDEIKSRTNGIVDGYKILNQSKTQSGNVKVKLEVKIAKFKLPKSAKRKKIAVIDFIPRQSCCSFKQADLNGDAVSNVLTDAVTNYLVQTRKFTVLDRNYQNLITGEKSRLTQGNVPANQLVKLGQELVADFLLVGTLNSLRLNEKEIKLKTTDKIINRSVGSLNLNFRVIDVATGQVKFSQNLNVNLAGVVNLSNGTDIALQEAVQETAKKAGYKILEAIYPFVIESINGDVLTIGTGGDLIKVGQKFKLIQYGSKIIDSYTKESLGRREMQIGIIEITEVTSKMSYAKILNLSKKDALNDFKPKSFIIRSMPERTKKDSSKLQEDLKKKLDKEFDDGW